jgi:hypothetical protein
MEGKCFYGDKYSSHGTFDNYRRNTGSNTKTHKGEQMKNRLEGVFIHEYKEN